MPATGYRSVGYGADVLDHSCDMPGHRWGARKGRRLYFIDKSFELTAETKYGGTVTNVKRKRVPGGGTATAKLREPKHVRTRGTANKLQSDE